MQRIKYIDLIKSPKKGIFVLKNKWKMVTSSPAERLANLKKENWEVFYLISKIINIQLSKFDISYLKDLYIAEAGIGRGESFQYLSYFAEKINCKILGFDSFCGFPEPKNNNDHRKDSKTKKGEWNINSIEEIKTKITSGGIKAEFINSNIDFIPGFFEDSLKKVDPNIKIFLLHLDVDLYSSYMCCLENLWDNVIEGGIILFDEYHAIERWPGAKKAIDEFMFLKGKDIIQDNLTNRAYVIK